MKGSAHERKIEVADELVAFGGIDLDGDVLLDEGFGGKVEQDRCADQEAAVLIAIVIGPALLRDRLQDFFAVEDGDLKIAPKIGRTRKQSRLARARIGGRDERGIGISEADSDLDLYSFGLTAVVYLSLLRAVVSDVVAGSQDRQRERRKVGDRRDLRAVVRNRKIQRVFFERAGDGFVVTLAEEVGFADGFFGKGSLESEGRLEEKNSGAEE